MTAKKKQLPEKSQSSSGQELEYGKVVTNRAIVQERFDDGYYHFRKDVMEYPEADTFVVWSRRGPGKTYSFLRYMVETEQFFIYMKRTNDDVELLCTGANNPDMKVDTDPFVPLNRDFGWNIKPHLIDKGIAGFYDCNEEGKPIGAPIGLIVSLNRVAKVKGSDMSKASWICFDEFVPQATEVVRRKEGETFLNFVMTVTRDKIKRGQKLKLALFANSEEISTPVTNELEIVDSMAEVAFRRQSHYYDWERGMVLHYITQQEIPLTKEELNSGMYRLMRGTAWAQKAFFGEFANNDFSNVKKLSIKNMQCLHKIHYKSKDMYIYRRPSDGMYYMCSSQGPFSYEWDLNKENHQKLFFIDHGQELRVECIEDKMKFEKYSMYDLIMNYRKIFAV